MQGTDRRVAIEGDKFVILDKHLNQSTVDKGLFEYHGHVRPFKLLPDKAKNALNDAGLVNPQTGRILPK